MATSVLTVTKTIVQQFGENKAVLCDCDFADDYNGSGGVILDVTDHFSEVKVAMVCSHGVGGYFIDIDPANWGSGAMALLIMECGADGDPHDEMADGTDASGVTGVQVLVVGSAM